MAYDSYDCIPEKCLAAPAVAELHLERRGEVSKAGNRGSARSEELLLHFALGQRWQSRPQELQSLAVAVRLPRRIPAASVARCLSGIAEAAFIAGRGEGVWQLLLHPLAGSFGRVRMPMSTLRAFCWATCCIDGFSSTSKLKRPARHRAPLSSLEACAAGPNSQSLFR